MRVCNPICRLVVLLLLLHGVSLNAQDAKKTNSVNELEYPTAEEIIDKYIMAIGGYEVVASRSTIHRIAHASSSSGQIFSYELHRNKSHYHVKFEMENGQVIERGVRVDRGPGADGKRLGAAWTSSGGTVRSVVGQELQDKLRVHSAASRTAEYLTFYKSVKFVSSETINDREVYKLLVTDYNGSEIENFFDAKTGLLRRTSNFELLSGNRHQVVSRFLELPTDR